MELVVVSSTSGLVENGGHESRHVEEIPEIEIRLYDYFFLQSQTTSFVTVKVLLLGGCIV